MDLDIGFARLSDFESPRLRLDLPMEAEELATPDMRPPDFLIDPYRNHPLTWLDDSRYKGVMSIRSGGDVEL